MIHTCRHLSAGFGLLVVRDGGRLGFDFTGFDIPDWNVKAARPRARDRSPGN